MLNSQFSILIRAGNRPAISSGLDGSRDNAREFRVFGENAEYEFSRKQGTFRDNPKPYCGFIEFLSNDAHFVNKVLAAFGAASLGVTGRACRAGAQDLVGNMSRLERPWKSAGKIDDAHGKVNQTFCKLIRKSDFLQHGVAMSNRRSLRMRIGN